MVQRGNGLDLALEAELARGVGGKMRGENFDGNGAVEPRVASAVDFTHTTRAQGRQYFVRTELRAWSEGHGRRRL